MTRTLPPEAPKDAPVDASIMMQVSAGYVPGDLTLGDARIVIRYLLNYAKYQFPSVEDYPGFVYVALADTENRVTSESWFTDEHADDYETLFTALKEF